MRYVDAEIWAMPALHGKTTLAARFPERFVDVDEIYRRYIPQHIHDRLKQEGAMTGHWERLSEAEFRAYNSALAAGEHRIVLAHGTFLADRMARNDIAVRLKMITPLPAQEWLRRATARHPTDTELALLASNWIDYRRAFALRPPNVDVITIPNFTQQQLQSNPQSKES